jgi:hypothetical protein
MNDKKNEAGKNQRKISGFLPRIEKGAEIIKSMS